MTSKHKTEKSSHNLNNYWVIWVLILAMLCAYLIISFIALPVIVNGDSMLPALSNGNMVIVNRLSVNNSFKPQDIIVFRKKSVDKNLLIKRIAAIPNDSVEIKDKVLYVNGSFFEECPNSKDFDAIIVPQDSYYVVGDNHAQSNDSRMWEHPFVAKQEIIGKVTVKLFPQFYIY